MVPRNDLTAVAIPPGNYPPSLVFLPFAQQTRTCDRLGLRGYSTHSNRRTWSTRLDKAGVRLVVDGGATAVSGGVGKDRVDAIAQF